MKFMVGFQPRPDRMLTETILRHRERISEVYFPWGEFNTGRGRLAGNGVRRQLETALREFRDAGIGLNLLLNANCYGRESLGRAFFNRIGDAAEELASEFRLDAVTTTSPLIARFFRTNFPAIEVRASVNMELATVQGFEYISEYFGGYYLARECNRSRSAITRLRNWCISNGKHLYLLANSGCLDHCSVHNFHDNLVAHEHEIAEMDNAYSFNGICDEYLSNPANRVSLIRDLSFLRPEETGLYEGMVDAIKLATRSNRNPAAVVEAYLSGRWSGNLLELLEPDHAGRLHPEILENNRFPEGFGRHLLDCGRQCDNCDYCKNVLRQTTINLKNTGGDVIC